MRLRATRLLSYYYSLSSFSTVASGLNKITMMNNDATIRHVLTNTKTIALIGASSKKERPSYYVMQYLLQKGYHVIPVNPGLEGKELLGQTVYGTLSSIPESIDMVDIFRNSEAVPPIVDEAISIGAKYIWMQLGVINEAAARTAKEAGLEVVMNTCPKIEMPRLGIDGPSAEL